MSPDDQCESETERLRNLVRGARHFARWMQNPMGIVGKDKAKATRWLKQVDAELGLVEWQCQRCGEMNDPDDRRCLGWMCYEERPQPQVVSAR